MDFRQREFCRKDDYGPEGELQLQPGDEMEREIGELKTWLHEIDRKVDMLMTEGCSHRGNDLARITAVQMAAEGVREEAGKIKDTVHSMQLQMSVETGTMSGRVKDLKIWILVQALAIALALLLQFVGPHVRIVESRVEKAGASIQRTMKSLGPPNAFSDEP
jgi:hypothetical protein